MNDEMEKIGDLAFQKIIKSAVLNSNWSLSDFIDNFDVSQGTIVRWIRGQSLPHPEARPAIVAWLKENFSKQEKKENESFNLEKE